jgi:hypothetical protein
LHSAGLTRLGWPRLANHASRALSPVPSLPTARCPSPPICPGCRVPLPTTPQTGPRWGSRSTVTIA